MNKIFFLKNPIRVSQIAFFFLFLLGIYFSKDFGVSWDEPYHRNSGKLTAAYLVKMIGLSEILNVPKAISEPDFYGYGTVFDTFCFVFENIFSLNEYKEFYLLRHALNYFVYFIGIYFFYLFIMKIYRDPIISFFLTMFYLLHPRLLGHSFFNGKDSIAQALVACSLCSIYAVFKKKDIRMSITAGFIVGLAIITRIPLLFFPFLVVPLIFFQNFYDKSKLYFSYNGFFLILSFIGTLFFSSYLFQPAFWGASISDLNSIFSAFKNFSWTGYNYYFGDFISAQDLPWHYIPAWILVTTPLTYLIFLIIGLIKIFRETINNFNDETLFNLFMLSSFILPILVIIILNSTLYDGWRHVFFVYPFIAYIMGIGFFSLYQFVQSKYNLSNKKILLILGTLTFCEPVFKIVSMHPHQQVYFNIFAGKIPTKKFEGDYWGLSMREGLEWILENDSRELIKVSSNGRVARINGLLLKRKDRKRIIFVNQEYTDFWNSKGEKKTDKIDYFLTNYREKESKDVLIKNKKYFPYLNEVYNVKVDNMKILGVYKFSENNIRL
jgi:hypothetical protein